MNTQTPITTHAFRGGIITPNSLTPNNEQQTRRRCQWARTIQHQFKKRPPGRKRSSVYIDDEDSKKLICYVLGKNLCS